MNTINRWIDNNQGKALIILLVFIASADAIADAVMYAIN